MFKGLWPTFRQKWESALRNAGPVSHRVPPTGARAGDHRRACAASWRNPLRKTGKAIIPCDVSPLHPATARNFLLYCNKYAIFDCVHSTTREAGDRELMPRHRPWQSPRDVHDDQDARRRFWNGQSLRSACGSAHPTGDGLLKGRENASTVSGPGPDSWNRAVHRAFGVARSCVRRRAGRRSARARG